MPTFWQHAPAYDILAVVHTLLVFAYHRGATSLFLRAEVRSAVLLNKCVDVAAGGGVGCSGRACVRAGFHRVKGHTDCGFDSCVIVFDWERKACQCQGSLKSRRFLSLQHIL